MRDEIVNQFAELWWASQRTVFANRFLGIPTLQHPFDAWITQEIIAEVKPEVIVESGGFCGGSALLWATVLDQLQPTGRVITIDTEDAMAEASKLPLFQARVDFLQGSSIDPAIVSEVKQRARGRSTLVVLDSLHAEGHVAAELDAYAPLVTPGSYLIVQDTVVNGHPIEPDHGPGPFEAVQAFLERDDRFEADRDRERLLFTFNPNGFLRRRR
jgi:cephalosporin hydroxylase